MTLFQWVCAFVIGLVLLAAFVIGIAIVVDDRRNGK